MKKLAKSSDNALKSELCEWNPGVPNTKQVNYRSVRMKVILTPYYRRMASIQAIIMPSISKGQSINMVRISKFELQRQTERDLTLISSALDSVRWHNVFHLLR